MSAVTAADLVALLPALAVTATALVLMIADGFLPEGDARPPAALTLLGLAVAGVLVAAGWARPDSLGFAIASRGPDGLPLTLGLVRADGFGLYVGGLLVASAALVTLMSVTYLGRRQQARAETYVLLLFATGGMMLLAVANDLILVFIALELFSLALYVLAGSARGERPSQEAAVKYFVLGSFAAGFLLYGVALVYAATGSTNLDAIGAVVAAGPRSLPPLAYVGLGFVLVGLGFKVALAPFHQWTPDVYEGAPTPVTAFMAVSTKAAAFAALARVLWSGFAPAAGVWLPLLGALAVLTMLVGNLAALVQSDLKRLLGYSAVAHGGYVLVAVLAGPPDGTAAALFYLVVYGLMNLGAFAVIIVVGQAGSGTPEPTGLEDLTGLAWRHPGLAFAMALYLLSLAGLPPTAGFLGKWYIFRAAVGADLTWLAVAVVLASVLSAFVYLRPLLLMVMPAPADAPALEAPALDSVAVAVTALVVGLAVVLAGPLVEGARAAGGLVVPGAPPAAREVVPVFVAPPDLDKRGAP